MADWRIRRAPPLQTEIEVPGDKSISHRALILAAISNGECIISGFLASEDCLSTMAALRALGIQIETLDAEDGSGIVVRVHGKKGVFTPPKGDIDCGNSGTTMRLMAGLLAGQPFRSRLVGDASLSRRPMKRVIEPLTEMGAKITAEGKDGRPPLLIEGSKLHAINYYSPVASAQVKGAVLLAGLFAKGKTSVTETTQSRDHTERMLEYFLVRPQKSGRTISVYGDLVPESRPFQVPGDISSAAFWLVAAAAQPRAHLPVRNVGLNKTRSGVLAVLVRMGAVVREYEHVRDGEPMGSIDISGQRLRGTEIAGAEVPNVIDELPILAVAGALAQGVTTIADAKELRVKESDRITAIATNLRAMGANVEETDDGLEIYGGTPLRGARLQSFGDHRIAMAFAIAGLFADGETVIQDVDCVNTSYPGFYKIIEQVTRESREHQ